MKLTASTVVAIAMPGAIQSQGVSISTDGDCAALIISPQDGIGILHAEAEERETRLEDDRVRDAERGEHGERAHDVREQVAAQDLAVADPHHSRRRHELRLAERE